MKLLVLGIFFLFQTQATNNPISELRNYFTVISESKTNVEKVMQLAKDNNQINKNLRTAYYASALMAEAKFKFDPISKISSFNSGKKMFEACINNDSTSLELRYMRLAIQKNVPGILGYSSEIKKDKNYLIENLSKIKTLDVELYSKISAFLLTQFNLSVVEKNALMS